MNENTYRYMVRLYQLLNRSKKVGVEYAVYFGNVVFPRLLRAIQIYDDKITDTSCRAACSCALRKNWKPGIASRKVGEEIWDMVMADEPRGGAR